MTLACLAGAGLVISWLLTSTLGENNDLGLRAIIPAEVILIVATAVALASTPRRMAIVAIACLGLALSLPDTVKMIHDNLVGKEQPDDNIFARAPELWAAVRRYAPPDARVANNPLFLQDLSPWPVNISWALLANRNSCFAGRTWRSPMRRCSTERREAIAPQFIHVFAGDGTARRCERHGDQI